MRMRAVNPEEGTPDRCRRSNRALLRLRRRRPQVKRRTADPGGRWRRPARAHAGPLPVADVDKSATGEPEMSPLRPALAPSEHRLENNRLRRLDDLDRPGEVGAGSAQNY